MPYSITTEDGITIEDIPDEVAPDAPELKERVAQIRGGLINEAPESTPEPRQESNESGGPVDALLGAGETALALGTGATGGTLGMIGGTLKGLAEQILSGQFGTDKAAELVAKSAAEGAGALTYAPRTKTGQEYTQATGEVLSQLVPITPFTAELGAIAQGAKAAVPMVRGSVGRLAGKGSEPDVPTARGAVDSDPPPADVSKIIRAASGSGMGKTKAQEELAALAKVNLEAKAAADRLGIDLPPDVFSDSVLTREAAGLTRSAVGEASAAWRDTVRSAADKADEAIGQIDASPDLASVSDMVRGSLKITRDSLDREAKKLYDTVDTSIEADQAVDLPTLRGTLERTKQEIGEGGLSPQERNLLKMLDEETVTYGRLIREKNLIGQALDRKDSPYGNMEAGALKKLYGALAEDQLANVEAIGGEALRQQLRSANFLYAKKKGLEKRIVNAFGQDTDGSIASLIRRSIEAGAKGDANAFVKLLKIVPPELKKETIATALMAVTRAKGGSEKGGFGFSEFATTYRGLRQNAPIYAKVIDALGTENERLLTDLYTVSKRITDARANVLTTGKANQALVTGLKAESLVGKILGTVAGRAAASGVAAAGGGPIAGSVAATLTAAMAGGRRDVLQSAGKLFASPEFQKMAVEAATQPKVSRSAVRQAVVSPAFRRFADKARLPKTTTQRELWLIEALQAESQTEGTPK